MTDHLSPVVLLFIIAIYFSLLLLVSWFTGKDNSNEVFFKAEKQSPWLLVAVGMIGTSISGVTFVSVPGKVGAGGLNMAFSYMQVVLGYLLGYIVIAWVLMPIYYKFNLTSIYGYLETRFGKLSYKTGAAFFLLSRTLGSALRLFLMAIILQKFIFDSFGIPFWLTGFVTLLFIFLYTFRGGIKTVIITDTFLATCFIAALCMTLYTLMSHLDLNTSTIVPFIRESGNAKMFFFESGWNDPNNFFKQFLSGALITIVMTGLDQDMMQKNLTCKTLKDAQKNMITFSIIIFFVNLLFLSLGVLLYAFAQKEGITIPANSDYLYPEIAFNYLSPTLGVVFILGIVAATCSSSDSALTSLTTSFCVDFLDFEKKEQNKKQHRTRMMVHLSFAFILLLMIIIFKATNKDAIINFLFKVAGITYGPLLGLFSFGVLTKLKIKDKWVVIVCLLAPLLTWILDVNSADWFNGFQFGFLSLALNGILTFIGLWMISLKQGVVEA